MCNHCLRAANAPVDADVAVDAIFGCAGASWLAARAFTTATLSVGEFQWEYKETIAGMILTCYRTPCGQCSYSCRAGASPLTRMQLPWVCMAPVNVGGRCKSRTRLSPLPRVARVARVVANERIMRLETFKVDAQCDSAAIFRRPSPSGGSQHCASSQACLHREDWQPCKRRQQHHQDHPGGLPSFGQPVSG